jgi:predicted glycogen debranching enzyme
MSLIRCGQDRFSDPEQALTLEWLETNGLGGYASSTIIGVNTRRYHGLLIAATKPPVGRMLLLSKLEETVIVGSRRYDLSANRYPGVIHPQGYRYLREFHLDPLPLFVYDLDGITVEKRVFMIDGENTTVIQYAVHDGECELEVRPLIAFRDYHAITHGNHALNPRLDVQQGMVVVAPHEALPNLYLSHNAVAVESGAGWYFNFEYDRERERGFDYREDLFNPVLMRFEISANGSARILASTEPREIVTAESLYAAEKQRRDFLRASSPRKDSFVQGLVLAADQFLVRRENYKTVVAGYHWFSDWGRDTMIALPGLTLTTGRFEVARKILQVFAENMSEGMLPNRFPDAGEPPEYNTVDATLWFFDAVRKYVAYTSDYEFVRKNLYDLMKESIDWHLRGTRYGIHVDKDGLLSCGVPGVQLTWMDAKTGDHVVTPRTGKPVEIQALWYNALRIMEELAGIFEDVRTAESMRDLAARACDSFNRSFWNDPDSCLYDVIHGENHDTSIRPNQIFAVSLHHSMLEAERASLVVEVVDRELRTPIGLRTLSLKHPSYRPRYEGEPFSRDSAYHQGTVWPWLIGPFISAYIRVHNGSDAARDQAGSWLQAFHSHMETACLGQISEIADGDAPHQPRGCVAQAWSVAELLRVTVEEVLDRAAYLA